MTNKKIISHAITVLFALLFAWYGFNNRSIFSDITTVSFTVVLLVGLGKLVMHVIQGLFTKWTAEVFTKKFTFGESIYIGVLSAAGNFFGPLLGGAGIRATYLKKSHGLAYNKFVSTMMGYYLMLFTVNSIVAILALFMIDSTVQKLFLIACFVGFLVLLLGLMFIKLPNSNKLNNLSLASNKYVGKIIEIIYGIEAGWRRILEEKRLLIKLFFLAVANFLAVLFMSYVEFSALGVNPGLASLSLYSVFITLSLLISITPGAIGVREALLIVVAGTLGVTNAEIIQVAIIDRGVNFILLILLFGLVRTKKIRNLLTPEKAVF